MSPFEGYNLPRTWSQKSDRSPASKPSQPKSSRIASACRVTESVACMGEGEAMSAFVGGCSRVRSGRNDSKDSWGGTHSLRWMH